LVIAGDDGLLAYAVNEICKATKVGLKDRLKALVAGGEIVEECDALMRCLALIEAETEASKGVSEAQAALDEKVLGRYGKLTEAEIKALVIEDKWLASLRAAIEGEVQRLTQHLAGRVNELDGRYSQPLATLEHELEASSSKVEGHLRKMGLAWQ
jgi:type I restriction enzyme M protein